LSIMCLLYSTMDTPKITNASKMDQVLNFYPILQIIERMYNNYYRHGFWPALVQVGILGVTISSALCLTKWNLISNDPRVVFLFVTILECSIACIFAPYFASKVNTASRLFLIAKCRGFSNIYTRKCILSKRPWVLKSRITLWIPNFRCPSQCFAWTVFFLWLS